MKNIIIFKCPYCKNIIEKNVDFSYFDNNNEFLFRHGTYKNNLKNIDLKHSDLECFDLFINNKLNGCGKKCIIKYNKNINTYSILKYY